ncbi:MAG: HAD-IA family hydrolase [Cocleimonas sp.]
MKQKTKPKFEVILFDLGGVLIELGEHALPTNWLNNKSFNSADWFQSPTALKFEKGQISAEEFAQALIQELELDVNSLEVIAAFSAWPKGVFPEVPKLLTALKGSYKLAVLSNSNALHWPRVLNEFQLSNYIDTMFSSHLINLAKPDIRAFKYVLNTMEVEAKDVLFFDDNQKNISTAKSLGIESVFVSSAKEIVDYFAL